MNKVSKTLVLGTLLVGFGLLEAQSTPLFAGKKGELYVRGGKGRRPIGDVLNANQFWLSIMANGIGTASIQNGAVTNDKIADETIKENKLDAEVRAKLNRTLAEGEITSREIRDETIRSTDLASGAVTSTKIQDGAIGDRHISSSVEHRISASKINFDNITWGSRHIAAGAINENHLGNQQVTSSKIKPNNILNAHIADNEITTTKIADGQVTKTDLAAASVDSLKIEDRSITQGDLGIGEIYGDVIRDGAITENKIRVGGVGANALAHNAVFSQHIANGQVTRDDLAPDSINSNKIENGSIKGEDISAEAIVGNHIKASEITSRHIHDGEITGDDIRNRSITNEKLAYGSVHGWVILEKSIDTAHLRDGAVTKAKMNIDLFEVPFTEIFGSANALVNNRLYVINRTYETGIDNTERNRFLGSIFLNRNFKKVYLRVWTEDTLTTANSARTFQVLNGANGEVVRVGGTPLECTIYPVDPNQNRNGRECSNYLASSSPIWNPLLILRATQTTGLPSAAFKWYLSFE